MSRKKSQDEEDESPAPSEAIRIEIKGVDALRSSNPVWPILFAVGICLNFWALDLPRPFGLGTQAVGYLLAAFGLLMTLAPSVSLSVLAVAALIASSYVFSVADPEPPQVLALWKRVVGAFGCSVILFDWLGGLAMLALVSFSRLYPLVPGGGPKLTLTDPEEQESDE